MTPPIFRPLSYEQARDAAAAEKKWLLVDVSAEWCQPCKHMDRTTWVAPEVVAWVNEYAVAIQLDGDHSPLVQELSVQAYPTLIIFDGQRELDRISGARPAAALLSWLKGLKSGRTELDELRATPKGDLVGQVGLAARLVYRQLDDEALEVFAWLWEHSSEIDAAWPLNHAFSLIRVLTPLLQRSEKAREHFRRVREVLATTDDRSAFMAFAELNHALGEDERTIAWLSAASPQQATRLQIHRLGRVLELTEDGQHLSTLGRLLEDGIATAEAHRRFIEERFSDPPAGLTEEDHARARRIIRESAATFARKLVRALQAAERPEEAAKLETWADELLAQKN